MKNSLNRFISALACAVLIIGLNAPVQAAEAPPADAIRVSSYKGTTLNTGEASGLIIYPNAGDCAAVSNAPDVVSVAQVLGRWTATAQAPGTATITVTAPDGRTGRMTITVASTSPAADVNSGDSAGQTTNAEIRRSLTQILKRL